MYYFMTHSTQFYFMVIWHTVRNHSDNKRNSLPPLHGLLLQSNDLLCAMPKKSLVPTVAFVIQIVEHWLQQEIAH